MPSAFVNPFTNQSSSSSGSSSSTSTFVNPFANETPQQTGSFSNPVQQPIKQISSSFNIGDTITNFITGAENTAGKVLTGAENGLSTVEGFASNIGKSLNQFRLNVANSTPITKQIGDILNNLGTGPLKGKNMGNTNSDETFSGNTPQDIASKILDFLPAMLPGDGTAIASFSKTKAAISAALQAGVQIVAGASPKEVIQNLPFGLLGGANLKEGPMTFTAAEAKGEVLNTDLANTPLGKELMKTSLEAEKTGDNIQISHDPTSNLKTPVGLPVKVEQVVAESNPTKTTPEGSQGIEPSVIQTVDTKTGETAYQTIPQGQLQQFHALIDETGSGVAGKDINGQIYHLTAKTPQQMFDAGAKFTGQANINDLQTSISQSIRAMNSPDDHILNPILDQVDAIIKENGKESTSTETSLPENASNQGGEDLNTKTNQASQRSNESTNQNSSERSSSIPSQGAKDTNSNSRVGVNGRSESTDSSRGKSDNTSSSADGNGQGLKVSKIAKEIDAKAVEKGFIDKGLDKLAGYSPQTVKEQSRLTTDLINNHFEDARAMIRGDKPVPKDINPAYLVKAMEDTLAKNPSGEVITELAKSPLVTGTSQAAQILRMAAERDPYSPLSIIQKLENDRRAVIEKQAGESINHVITKDVAKGTKEISKAISQGDSGSKGKLAEFIRGIQC